MGDEQPHNDKPLPEGADGADRRQPSDPRPGSQEIERSGEAEDLGDADSFPIVGVGASAGGLEAFTQLLQGLPADTGMAFVLVQHLDPKHASMLAEILSRVTSMSVSEVHDEPLVEPNHVYIIPPARNMIITGGHFKLLPREEIRGQQRSVDSFLRSLAEEQKHRAIGVVLSGTGTDGTLGMQAIKADGGITFAQDESAPHSGMPLSAIVAGCVDFILPPEKIAEQLVRIGRHPYVLPARISEDAFAESNINKILRLLHDATGVDFAHYKSTTLYRRITRRMLLHNLEGLDRYLEVLQNDAAEVQALYHDILISVTSFFRDPEAFEILRRDVFPKLLRERPRNDMLRCWVLGCSTGEEAYSIAITLAELCLERGAQIPAQVFATDLNEQSIDRARIGIYAKTIAQDVSPERLRRFFVETDRGYQVSKTIRDMCVFARQNVLSDPPFSRMDMISCRNLLIYMEPELQRRVMPLFHYALKPRGYLWLGMSESVGAYSERFDVVDVKHKLFARKPGAPPNGTGNVSGNVPLFTRAWDTSGAERARHLRLPEGGADLQREADRLAVARYAPPGVLVNAAWDILQFRGDTSPYLAPAPGKPSVNLLKMAREGLLVGLRTALQRAITEGAAVRHEGLRVKSNGGFRDVNLEVLPLRETTAEGRCFLILFEQPGAALPQARRDTSEKSEAEISDRLPDDKDRQVEHLTLELASTRDYLQSLIEQQDAANEELQSANEEIQSSNEELQSINEELQTTKEEIQSSNEELTTVNEELRDRNDQLTVNNNDLLNFLASTQLALIMLGPDLRIRRFTPQAEKLLNLIATDVGRPIDDIKLPLNAPDLNALLTEVIDSVVVKEFDVQDRQGRWYSLRLRPYKTADNKIDGAVVVLVDMDAQKHTEQLLRASDERYRLLMEGAEGIAIILLDEKGIVRGWNVGAQRIFGYVESEIVGQHFGRFYLPEDTAAGRPDRELKNARENRPADDDNWLLRKDGSRFWATGTTSILRPEGTEVRGYAKVVRDVSERRESAEILHESEARFRALFERGAVGIEQVSGEGRFMLINDYMCQLLGFRREELENKDYAATLHPDDRAVELAQMRELCAGRIETYTLSHRRLRKDGSCVWVLCSSAAVRDASGKAKYRVSVIQDISGRKAAEDALKAADHRKDEFLAMLAHELRNPLAPLQTTLDVLRLSSDPAALEHGRPIMERQVEKLTRLVDDLLDASRITQGKIVLQKALVDLKEVVVDSLESTEQLVEAAGQHLSVSLPQEPVFVDGDAVRLEQVVVNLLSNAVRYTDRGGKIELSLERRQQEALVRVKDNGIGIPAEVLPHIFEMFVQADRSPGRERGGLGIGLSIVQQLVMMHQGRVEVHSAGRGQGSEFSVALPLVAAPAPDAAKLPQQTNSRRAAVSTGRRILVVDDNADAANSLGKLLSLNGHQVEVEHAGPAALQRAATFKPDVVLLDIGLPGMDGYEVASQLRQRPETGGVLLVALSGYGQDDDRRRSKSAGFDEHLVKPVNLSTLETLLANGKPRS